MAIDFTGQHFGDFVAVRRRKNGSWLFRCAKCKYEKIYTPALLRGSFAKCKRCKSGELTQSERKVADLVAQGLTNREIAKCLILSERTVNTHLSNAFRRLGLHNRTELAQYVFKNIGEEDFCISLAELRSIWKLVRSNQANNTLREPVSTHFRLSVALLCGNYWKRRALDAERKLMEE